MGEAPPEPDPEEWDLDPVLALVMSASVDEAEAAWVDALPTLSQRFAPDDWGIAKDVNSYGTGSHANLFRQEVPTDFRNWLEEHQITADEYGDYVGAIQFVSVQLFLLAVMPRGRANTGWRVRLVGFPSLGLVVCGLGHHYQGTPAQSRLGRASGLIRSRALEVLDSDLRARLETWPAATAEDWDERGLFAEFEEPVRQIGTLDISGYDEDRGARLRMIRNTTVKKDLATFFAIKGLSAGSFLTDGAPRLLELRDLAFALGGRQAS